MLRSFEEEVLSEGTRGPSITFAWDIGIAISIRLCRGHIKLYTFKGRSTHTQLYSRIGTFISLLMLCFEFPGLKHRQALIEACEGKQGRTQLYKALRLVHTRTSSPFL